MQFFRVLLLLLFLGVIGSFLCFIVTGQARFKRYGLTTLKWTLSAGLVFFGILIVQRIF